MAYTKTQKKTNSAGTTTVKSESSNYKVKKDFDLNMLVPVKNGSLGKLVYKSKRQNGLKIVWNELGQEEYMELSELVSARNSSPAFFEKNWFMFEDPDIIEYLNVGKYYKNSINIENINEVFSYPPEKIKETISKAPDGQKPTIIKAAKDMIKNGEIDSIKVINAIEESTNTDLT